MRHAVSAPKNLPHDTANGDLEGVCLQRESLFAIEQGAFMQGVSVYGDLQHLIRMKGRNAVSTIETHRFSNGLQLLVEPKKNVKSVYKIYN